MKQTLNTQDELHFEQLAFLTSTNAKHDMTSTFWLNIAIEVLRESDIGENRQARGEGGGSCWGSDSRPRRCARSLW